MSDQRKAKFRDVIQAERNELRRRREQALLKPTADSEATDAVAQLEDHPPVGLALSGGGIRSASVALGLLQAFYRRGILRQIDYLSTVSGGGYAGSFLSSSILAQKEPVDWSKRSPPSERVANGSRGRSSERRRLPLDNEAHSEQPEGVRRLATRGESLRRPLKAASRWFWGFLVVNAMLISGLLAAAAFGAWLFRLLDSQEAQIYLHPLGALSDVSRAFLPATILLVLWLVSQAVYSLLRRHGRTAPDFPAVILLLFFVSVGMALMALFATGDISLRHVQVSLGWSEQTTTVIDGIIKTLGQICIFLLSVSVVPLLRPSVLLRSGTAPANKYESWIFNAASYGVVYGIPAILFWFLVSENVSNFNAERGDQFTLAAAHVPQSQLKAFCTRLQQETHDPTWRSIGRAFSDHLEDTSNRSVAEDLIRIQQSIDERNRNTWLIQRWPRYVFGLIGVSNTFENNVDEYRRFWLWRQELAKGISDSCLSNPQFYRLFGQYDRFSLASDNERRRELAAPSNWWFHDGIRGVSPGHPEVDTWRKLLDRGQRLEEVAGARGTDSRDGNWLLKEMNAAKLELSELEASRPTIDDVELGAFKEKVRSVRSRHDELVRVLTDVRETNWAMFELHCARSGIKIKPPNEVFGYVVNAEDQKSRLRIAGICLAIFVAVGLLIPVNPTSLHCFYRDVLGETWIAEHPEKGQRIPLSALDTCSKGGPYHVLNGTLNLFGRRMDRQSEPTVRFTFSRLFCGSKRVGYRQTGQYLRGEYDLANAMAVSGAAFHPLQVENVLVRALLLIMNLRLGQWLPNPSNPPTDVSWPSLFSLGLGNWLWRPENRTYCFVSDGGHHENTGIRALMERRCRVIIACDASQDEQYLFEDLQKLMNRGESKYGIRVTGVKFENNAPTEIPLSFRTLRPKRLRRNERHGGKLTPIDKGGFKLKAAAMDEEEFWSDQHFIVVKIVYPNDDYSRDAGMWPNFGRSGEGLLPGGEFSEEARTGYLIYIKPTIGPKLGAILDDYARKYKDFPHDPTLDQLFDRQQFYAYRSLGDCLGEHVCEDLFKNELQSDSANPDKPVEAWLSRWPGRRREPPPLTGGTGAATGEALRQPQPTQDFVEEDEFDRLKLAISALSSREGRLQEMACLDIENVFQEERHRVSSTTQKAICDKIIKAFKTKSRRNDPEFHSRVQFSQTLFAIGEGVAAVVDFFDWCLQRESLPEAIRAYARDFLHLAREQADAEQEAEVE